ncbi:MAG: hypothetical protein JXR48_17435 [Candidatus Delongbacteria bacterium]|nr:hypothetical protein [Candidatus Delongbacteria bacterium]MBN2836743.1 hypothetical protein [Candidatus Delongbacteria bacterium]
MSTDVIINVFGKPWQTLLTIYSLMEFSASYVDKIFLIFEPVEIINDDTSFDFRELVLKNLGVYKDKAVSYVPKFWFRSDIPIEYNKLQDPRYRHSIRYQYGIERSKSSLIFLSHNDCKYTGDIIGKMLENISDYDGIGSIGQCWNCPASWENLCNSENYENYKPNYNELRELYWESIPPEEMVKRPYHSPDFNKTIIDSPWPLPECRINEWATLIKRDVLLDNDIPFGSKWGEITVFDTGVEWFRRACHRGYRFLNFDIYQYVNHTAGRPVMLDKNLYNQKENYAKNELINKYGLKL